MDIQLFATDEELQVFPENKTDSSTVQDKTPNTKSINLAVSDLPRSHSDLPKIPSKLPEHKSRCRSRKGNRHQSRPKNPIGGRQANTAKNPVDRQASTSKYPIVGQQLAQAQNPIVDHLAAQTNDQLDTKQEIQWIGKPIHETYLDQLVGPSEAALPGQPALGPPEIAPPVARQLEAHQPVLHPPVVRPPMWSVSPWSTSPYSVSPWSISPVITFPRCCPFISSPTWTRSLEPSHPRHYGTSSLASRSARTY